MGHPPFIPYRRNLKANARSLRRDPTPAERKLDFYCPSRLLVVEVDGDSHFSERGAKDDEARTAALASLGIRVVRVSNLEVMEQFEGVCQRIAEALESKT